MRSYWLFPSLLGVVGSLLVSAPAQAGTLQSWRFSPSDNRLVFTTNGDVQPRAQLIANPERLVIDLPGTTVGRPMVSQPGSQGVREVRVGQFDAQTTRIVVELESGYTLDPQQVQVRGATPSQWSVQIPTPQRDLAAHRRLLLRRPSHVSGSHSSKVCASRPTDFLFAPAGQRRRFRSIAAAIVVSSRSICPTRQFRRRLQPSKR